MEASAKDAEAFLIPRNCLTGRDAGTRGFLFTLTLKGEDISKSGLAINRAVLFEK
jgi:hypothetical protein